MAGDKSNIKQLDKILGVAKKVDKFSPNCSHCSGFQDEISNAVDDLIKWPDTIDKQNENYVRTLEQVTKHLREGDMHRPKSFQNGIVCWIGGLLLLFPYTFTALAEIKVLPFILLALVFILFMVGLVFFINGFISLFSPKKNKQNE